MRKFKFKLNRKALEAMYFSFIRPILEYADVVWDNCTKTQEQDLEKIHIEAARIITGTTKLVSIDKLYIETGWETLKVRRFKHRLTLFYKMNEGLTPTYLSALVPENVGNLVNYNLRNAANTRTLNCNTQLYANSFLPASIQDWNNLPYDVKHAPSLSIFKSKINSNIIKTPKHFYYLLDRKSQIMHSRLRTQFSGPNQHLHSKNIIENPYCSCSQIENMNHFFLECVNYTDQRRIMNPALVEFGQVSLSVLFSGDETLSFGQNVLFF